MTKFTKTETIVKETTHEIDISLDDLYLLTLQAGKVPEVYTHPVFEVYDKLTSQLKELGYEF